jgi:hypothetical protein
MSKYIDLDMQSLVDLLVIHTTEYNKMLSSGFFSVEEFTQCKQQLAEIHAAIKENSKKEGYSMEYILPNFPEDVRDTKVSK